MRQVTEEKRIQHNIMSMTYYLKNKEVILERRRIRYKNNPLLRKAVSKKYYQENKASINAKRRGQSKIYTKEYYLKNRESIRDKAKIKSREKVTVVCVDCGKSREITCGAYMVHKKITTNKCPRCSNGVTRGEDSRFWKGGVTVFRDLLRTSSDYLNWRKQIYERDNFTCQECGDNNGGNLEAHHHIKSFSILMSEFLKEFSQFSPIDDKETLVRLSTTYQPFWDVDNGRTLCPDCHKKTDNYLVHRKAEK